MADRRVSSYSSDFTIYFKQSMDLIRQDSVEKAVHLLWSAMRQVRSLQNVDRILPYDGIETFNLIEEMNDGRLSLEEKKLAFTFLKTTVNRSTEKDLAEAFKHTPNSLFKRRLHVYFLYLTNPDKIDGELDELLKESPGLISANILKAQKLFDEEKYQESASLCSKIIAASPAYAYAFLLRGEVMYESSEYEKAIDDYNHVIKVFPKNDEAYYERGNTEVQMDNYRDAITDYKRINRFNEKFNLRNYNLARSYNGLEMRDSAMYYINLHIDNNPDDSFGYDIKGDIYYGKDDYQSAIDLYTHAIKIDPKRASLYEDRGDAYYYYDKHQEAITDYKKAISLGRHTVYLTDMLGDCYYELNEFDKAVSYHQKAIEIDPKYKYAYVGLNRAYNKTGNYTAAINSAKKAIEIDSTYSGAYGDVGWTYYLKGDFDTCIEFSYKAIKYDESATYAMFNIGLATLCKGDFEKAKEIYSSYVSLCKEKGYEIMDGATSDLHDLIKKNLRTTEARYILEHIFEEKQ